MKWNSKLKKKFINTYKVHQNQKLDASNSNVLHWKQGKWMTHVVGSVRLQGLQGHLHKQTANFLQLIQDTHDILLSFLCPSSTVGCLSQHLDRVPPSVYLDVSNSWYLQQLWMETSINLNIFSHFWEFDFNLYKSLDNECIVILNSTVNQKSSEVRPPRQRHADKAPLKCQTWAEHRSGKGSLCAGPSSPSVSLLSLVESNLVNTTNLWKSARTLAWCIHSVFVGD